MKTVGWPELAAHAPNQRHRGGSIYLIGRPAVGFGGTAAGNVMATWLNLAAIGMAGAVGSLSRYLITLAAAAVPGGSTLWGTVIANLLGCAAIGALSEYGLADDGISERLNLAIRVGFLGGLTTFSTFAAESTALAVGDRWGAATLYVAANLLIGWAVLLAAASAVRGWMA